MSLSPATSDPRPDAEVDSRPWGAFTRYTLNQKSTVKIITVRAGCRLSLQRHRRRDEWWTVLDGPLEVQIDGSSWLAEPGEQIWIPRGTAHRAGAPTGSTGRFLEVAFGDFDECDIERLEDDYDR
jgi:mannose-6-phosphate isomerase-like protein (cupin superfamily)